MGHSKVQRSRSFHAGRQQRLRGATLLESLIVLAILALGGRRSKLKVYPMQPSSWTAVFACIWTLVACAGDESQAAEPSGDSRLNELNAAEFDYLCNWGIEQSTQRVPQGTNCDGYPIRISGCMRVNATCTVTVAQLKTCLPMLLERIAREPCAVRIASSSLEDFANFVDETPDCENLGMCVTSR